MDGIYQGCYVACPGSGFKSVRVLNWNIERGLKLPAILDFVESQRPDLCIFQEVDRNANRTGKRDIADLLAARFGLDYVFGVEFEELSQGSESDPAFHGQAVFARASILRPRVLRFNRQSNFWQPHWFLPRWAKLERRSGGRMALATEIAFGSACLMVYDVHLESRGDDGLRLAQLSDVVRDSLRYPPDVPVVIAGDLNSYHTPSPLTKYLLHSGFEDACDGSWHHGTKPNGKKLDWIFIRGKISYTNSQIHYETKASDHYPISTTLTLGT